MVLVVKLNYFINLLSSIAVIIPIIVGIITAKKHKIITLHLIFFYCLVCSVFEIIAWYYFTHHLQNHFLFNMMSYFDILVWGLFYYLLLDKLITKRIIIFLVAVTLMLTFWSHFGTGRDFNRMDSFALSVGSISLMAMSLLFFYQLLNNLDIKNIFIYPFFWINVGVLIYFSGSFFSFIFAEYIAFSPDKNITQYIGISAILLFFHRIFLAIGLWFSTTPIQSNLSSK